MSAIHDEMIPPQGLRRAGAATFGLLFLLESLVRAFNSGVLSIQAYDLLGSTRAVSILGIAASFTVLMLTLCMPYLFGHLRRRYAYTLGGLMLIGGSIALASFTIGGQVLGVILRNAGASIMNVTLQLYIMDHIKKSELTRSEPLRLAVSTLAWVSGPVTGVWLYSHYGPVYPQLAAMAVGVLVLIVFWFLRLHETSTMPSGTLAPFNPLANAVRFVEQPRLRLAWAIAFGRSCFWATFFTYGPLLMIEGGMSKFSGGLVISISQFFLLSTFGFGALAQRFGVRVVITLCFAVVAGSTILAGLFGVQAPLVVAGLLLLAALFASGVDGVGGIPYLRAVRPSERQRMTAVYRTFIDFSELIPGFVFAFALSFFDVSIVFIILGVCLVFLAILVWRYLPKSM
ncbi:MAG: MFS transporter [Alphaproteobacteria bacterium]|nr:MFS transporter [Alphaproteobacteria bacterium]